MESGKLSVKVQVGIIAAAFGVIVFALLSFFGMLGRPPQAPQVDQAILDAQWNP